MDERVNAKKNPTGTAPADTEGHIHLGTPPTADTEAKSHLGTPPADDAEGHVHL